MAKELAVLLVPSKSVRLLEAVGIDFGSGQERIELESGMWVVRHVEHRPDGQCKLWLARDIL